MSQKGTALLVLASLLATVACSRSETVAFTYGDPLGGGGFSDGDPRSGGGAGSGGLGTGGFGTGAAGSGGFGTGGFGAGGFGTGAAGSGGFGTGGFGTGAAGSGGFGTGGFGTGGFGTGSVGGGGVPTGGAGGSVSGPCSVDAECAVPDPCVTTRCLRGVCAAFDRDEDADGAVPVACGGGDCNDLNPLVVPGARELCADGSDNDCNGVADCADPACAGRQCGCVVSPGGEQCENGVDDDCNGAVDCNDPACIGTPACGCASREVGVLCTNGIDDDCDRVADCDDGDCFFAQECACAASTEICSGGTDEDCDGLIDCADPACTNDPACLCVPPGTRERCDDGTDNDCDGLVDCADADCTRALACAACGVEVCTNGTDDDCDGAIDCADAGCRFDPSCAPVAESCQNGIDDDRDGLIDCSDPDCATNPACAEQQSNCLTARTITASGTYVGDTTGNVGEATGECGGAAGEAVFRLVLTAATRVSLDTIGSSFDTALHVRWGSCTAGRELACDDDGGGVAWSSRIVLPILQPGTYFVFVDGYTVDPVSGPDEGAYVLNVDLGGDPAEDCENRVDDDGDSYADCADADCARAAACLGCVPQGTPGPEFGATACTNGLDDDCDGLADCEDPDCNANPNYPAECCDGIDENGNGVVDDFACRCASDADCLAGEVCYDRSNGACGPPCSVFVGNVCDVVAPGAACNSVTEQCEF